MRFEFCSSDQQLGQPGNALSVRRGNMGAARLSWTTFIFTRRGGIIYDTPVEMQIASRWLPSAALPDLRCPA